MQEQQLWKLVAGKLTGEASTTERLILNKYLQANKCLADSICVLTHFWQTPIEDNEAIPELAFEKILKSIGNSNRK